MRTSKADWQRRERRAFKETFGYSQTSFYRAGGMREVVLQRDDYRCVKCGMTDDDHRKEWGRPITVDHKDRDRRNNDPSNLQTLCLRCHGRKDITPRLIERKVEAFKDQILDMRARRVGFGPIADELGFGITAIWKWCRIWGDNTDLRRKETV